MRRNRLISVPTTTNRLISTPDNDQMNFDADFDYWGVHMHNIARTQPIKVVVSSRKPVNNDGKK
jgi:hypothetical protein